jgi:translation elongation factor aEF-1 beta
MWVPRTIGVQMGKVVVQLKVFPTDIAIDRERLKEELKTGLPQGAQLVKFDEEPIAFGLVALIATITMIEDLSGLMQKVEDSIKSNKNVGEVQTVAIGRL